MIPSVPKIMKLSASPNTNLQLRNFRLEIRGQKNLKPNVHGRYSSTWLSSFNEYGKWNGLETTISIEIITRCSKTFGEKLKRKDRDNSCSIPSIQSGARLPFCETPGT